MPPVRRELPGQGLLFNPSELEVLEPVPQIVLSERAAPGRMLGHRAMSLLNLSPENFTDITQETLQAIAVPRLEQDLYEPGKRTISGLALNAVEYGAMVRWAKPLRTAGESRTEERTLETRPDRKRGRIYRAGAHNLENQIEKSEVIVRGLVNERFRLARYQAEVEGLPWRAHMDQAAQLELYRQVVDFSFMNIIEVVAHRRKLSPVETQQLKDGLGYRLTTTPQAELSQYLKDMTGLAVRYTDKRTRLFKNKVQIARTAATDSRKDARKFDDSK